MDSYKSIMKQATSELIERKSRFICNVSPVNTEEEAVGFVKKISGMHKDATHNVFAYIVSGAVETQKASDDGEPQGTAGIPVLEVIKREGLINVCVVVTRYFGGILLGAGGLIRAYSSAARNGLIEGRIVTMARFTNLSITIGYPLLGKVQNIVTSIGNTIVNIEYTELVKIYVKCRFEMLERTVKLVRDAANGQVLIENIKNYYDVSED